jgi:hypothetical protein
MFEFLTTPEGQKVVAFVTVAIIALAFFFRLHPFKGNSKPHIPTAEWTGSSYYIFLMAAIKTCTTYDQLEKTKRLVERFFNTRFSDKISGKERMGYYTRLHEALTEKENFLEENTLSATLQPN